MWQPCLQSTPSFQRRRPPNLQIFNITDQASVCSKCADVPTDETGNPFGMLQKRSSVKREKGHTGDNLSNTTTCTVPAALVPLESRKTDWQEAPSNACQHQLLWPEGVQSAWETEPFHTKLLSFLISLSSASETFWGVSIN